MSPRSECRVSWELDFCKLSFRIDISIIVHQEFTTAAAAAAAAEVDRPMDGPILFLVCVGSGGGESLVLRPQLIDGVAHRVRALLVQLAVLGPELEVEHLQ